MTAADGRPVLALVSPDIRRDLIVPLRRISRFRLVHFYRRAPYDDLDPDDLDPSLCRYRTPADLLAGLRAARPDLVQGVEPFAASQFPFQAAVMWYVHRARALLYFGVHVGLPLTRKYGRSGAEVLRRVTRPLIKRASLFFYLNNHCRRNLEWLGVPPGRIKRHMYGTWGVDPAEFTPLRDGTEPAWGPGPHLLFVGRLSREKGLSSLLTSFSLVNRQIPEARLHIIGGGPVLPAARDLARSLGVVSKVEFLGPVRNRKLPAFFRAADLLLSPSVTTGRFEECVGMVNIQAMSCGLPVVSTRSGGIPEYVPDGRAGLLVEENNPRQLAEASLKLAHDSRLSRSLGRYGRTWVQDRCDAATNVLSAQEILWELWKDRRGNRF